MSLVSILYQILITKNTKIDSLTIFTLLRFLNIMRKKIVDQLREIGWKTPLDTDSNSTNCRLNAFANQCHLQRHGFHPYVMEIANMVRQGVMTRDEGVQKIYTEQNQEEVEYARERLGL